MTALFWAADAPPSPRDASHPAVAQQQFQFGWTLKSVPTLVIELSASAEGSFIVLSLPTETGKPHTMTSPRGRGHAQSSQNTVSIPLFIA